MKKHALDNELLSRLIQLDVVNIENEVFLFFIFLVFEKRQAKIKC